MNFHTTYQAIILTAEFKNITSETFGDEAELRAFMQRLDVEIRDLGKTMSKDE